MAQKPLVEKELMKESHEARKQDSKKTSLGRSTIGNNQALLRSDEN